MTKAHKKINKKRKEKKENSQNINKHYNGI